MKKVLLFTPITIYIVFLVVNFLPNGFSVMPEPSHPWYTPYTSILFLLTAFWFYPVTFTFQLLGLDILGAGYFLASAIYTLFITVLFRAIQLHIINRSNKANA